MALIKCPECGGKVSSKANVCIHCGYPLKKKKENEEMKKELEKLRETIAEQGRLQQTPYKYKEPKDYIKEAMDEMFPTEPFDFNKVTFPLGWYF